MIDNINKICYNNRKQTIVFPQKGRGKMQTERGFYICPTCFQAAEVRLECHGHMMIHYDGFPVRHRQLKPLEDREGNLKTHAPRWFLAKVQPFFLDRGYQW